MYRATKDTAYIAHVNPLCYRDYYYDSDTGLYYLQSRYYVAVMVEVCQGVIYFEDIENAKEL